MITHRGNCFSPQLVQHLLSGGSWSVGDPKRRAGPQLRGRAASTHRPSAQRSVNP